MYRESSTVTSYELYHRCGARAKGHNLIRYGRHFGSGRTPSHAHAQAAMALQGAADFFFYVPREFNNDQLRAIIVAERGPKATISNATAAILAAVEPPRMHMHKPPGCSSWRPLNCTAWAGGFTTHPGRMHTP